MQPTVSHNSGVRARRESECCHFLLTIKFISECKYLAAFAVHISDDMSTSSHISSPTISVQHVDHLVKQVRVTGHAVERGGHQRALVGQHGRAARTRKQPPAPRVL